MKKLLVSILLAIIATLASFGLTHLKAVKNIELLLFDIRQLAFAPKTTANPNIAIVLLDESTMKGLPYRTPIPRDFLASLHRKIAAANPGLIAYDIFFKDSSFTDADISLSNAFRAFKPYAVAPLRPDGTVDQPLDLFAKEISGTGLADLPINPNDATLRTARLEFKTKEGLSRSFATMIADAAIGGDATAHLNDKNLWPHVGPFHLSPFVENDRDIFIRFAGPPGKTGGSENVFKIYSAGLVEKGVVPPSWLTGKIVIIGAGYEDLKDAYLTPYFAASTNYSRMNGVEIHANILSNLLTRQYYFVPARWQIWTVIFFAAFLITGSTACLPLSRAAAVFSVWILLVPILATFVFHSYSFVLPVAGPLAGSFLAFGLGLLFRALTEGKERRFIKSAFAQYVPVAVVNELAHNPKALRLGGEERTITSIFTDIASFTSISEQLDPKTLVTFLNKYLSRMNDSLFAFGATLDKYEGDAIIAFFNAPLELSDHELKATRAAIGIQHASKDISKNWKDICGRSIVTRVGLNSGRAVVGNMGSAGRFDYTAIGDTINLASRLEGINKFYGTTILASESVALKLDESIITRPVDRVRAKGKQRPVLIHEILDDEEYIDKALIGSLIRPYRQAFELFESREFSRSKKILISILSSYPNDLPSKKLLERCERAEKEPSWDLITEMTIK